MANPIPGTELLGWGFDIFGEYSSDSKTNQLFLLPDIDRTWTYGPTGETYNLPQNVSVEALTESSASSNVFSTRSEVEESFALKAGLSATFGAFSGQFEISYSNTTTDDSEYSYGIYEMYNWNWRLNLQDQSVNGLAPWVTSDPDYTSLPDSFDKDNAALFYRFFKKYGAFYVSSVKVGGRLYYSVAVDKSYTTSREEISAKLDLEYKAVFSARANSQANWNQATAEWTFNRVVSIRALGGNNQPLNIIVPGFNDNFDSLFTDWIGAVATFPVSVDFEVAPIWRLFSGAKADAVEQAFEAFTHDRIYVESKPTASSIIVVGTVQRPDNSRPDNSSGCQVCVLDRSTLEARLNAYYSFDHNGAWWFDWQTFYDQMYADMREFNNDSYIVIVVTFGMIGAFFPTQDFYDYLLSCGADIGLGGWDRLFNLQESMDFKGINYALVGVPGRGPGTGFQTYKEGEWRQFFSMGGSLLMSNDVAPTATMSIHLRELPGLGVFEPALLRVGK